MTTTVRTNHPVRFQIETWVPAADDGASRTPGHWALESEGVLAGDDESPQELTDALGPGRAIKIWVDAA